MFDSFKDIEDRMNSYADSACEANLASKLAKADLDELEKMSKPKFHTILSFMEGKSFNVRESSAYSSEQYKEHLAELADKRKKYAIAIAHYENYHLKWQNEQSILSARKEELKKLG